MTLPVCVEKRTSEAEAVVGRRFYGTAKPVPFVRETLFSSACLGFTLRPTEKSNLGRFDCYQSPFGLL
jgi:hypothetical protein